MTRKELFKTIKNGRDSYKKMVEFCADSMILNNDIIPALQAKDFYFDFFCGSDYDEEEDCYIDIFQYFIIDYSAAERFAEYTNEIVMYNEELDLYILCVTHCGTGWDYVPANWKSEEEFEEE